MTDRSRIQRTIEQLENDIAALRRALEIIDGPRAVSATRRHKQTITKAIAVDAGRRAQANGNGAEPHGATAGRPVPVGVRREASAAFLATFDPVKPSQGSGASRRGLGSLVRRGYLKKKAGGYVRTAKEYTV